MLEKRLLEFANEDAAVCMRPRVSHEVESRHTMKVGTAVSVVFI